MKRTLRVYKKTVSIVNETAIGMYQNLVGNKVGFLLESYDKNYDRYTFMGAEPEELISSEGQSLVITRADGSREVRKGNPLNQLKAYYSEFEIKNDHAELNFSGGLVGQLGYDFIRYTEVLPDDNPDEIGIETIQMMLMTKFLMIDHVAETMTAVVLRSDDEDGKRQALEEAENMIREARKNRGQASAFRFQRDGRIIRQSDTLEEYSAKVEKSNTISGRAHFSDSIIPEMDTGDKAERFDLYRELRELNPSPYLYYFNFGSFEVIGSSPEMIVKQQGKRVYTCPIAGTRPRGKTKDEDKHLTDELLADEKRKSGTCHVGGSGKNDMGRVSEFGSVKVTDFMKIQYYSHVMHIVSLVEGRKKERTIHLIWWHPFFRQEH